MIYTCSSCRFTFSRVGEIENCPDCGKPYVREATDKEKDEYIKYHEEINNKKDKLKKNKTRSE